MPTRISQCTNKLSEPAQRKEPKSLPQNKGSRPLRSKCKSFYFCQLTRSFAGYKLRPSRPEISKSNLVGMREKAWIIKAEGKSHFHKVFGNLTLFMTGMEATAEVNRDQLCKCTQGVPRTPKPSEEVTKALGSLDVPINSWDTHILKIWSQLTKRPKKIQMTIWGKLLWWGRAMLSI